MPGTLELCGLLHAAEVNTFSSFSFFSYDKKVFFEDKDHIIIIMRPFFASSKKDSSYRGAYY